MVSEQVLSASLSALDLHASCFCASSDGAAARLLALCAELGHCLEVTPFETVLLNQTRLNGVVAQGKITTPDDAPLRVCVCAFLSLSLSLSLSPSLPLSLSLCCLSISRSLA